MKAKCLKCGETFEKNRKDKKYCSSICYKRAKAIRHWKKCPEQQRSTEKRTCSFCNKDYFPKKYHDQEFCSRKCVSDSRKQFLSIPDCLEAASRKLDKNIGYVRVYCPMHPKANTWGYVYEHRLIMEGIVGRYLEPDEHVHHKNGKRWDNTPHNLELLKDSEHGRLTAFELRNKKPARS